MWEFAMPLRQKTKILIVDDYQKNVLALAELIAADHIEVITANNGQEALEKLLDHEFALALLDVEMPGMSGFDLARMIRGVKRYRHLPLIFVTAHQFDQSYIFEGYHTGAVDLLFKPLDPHVVRSKVNIFVELSEQRRMLEAHVKELDQLRSEANEANVAKSQFLANMSHEIRTPLAAILGYSHYLSQDGVIPVEEKNKMGQTIQKNGELLLKIISDILDLSKIEANRLELDNVQFDVSELLNDIKATVSFRAESKGIELDFDIADKPEWTFLGDPLRIKQVILNIVGNAIKFTKKGKVQIQANLKEVTDEKKSCILSLKITDTGIGMTEEQMARLFQPFMQADHSVRRQFGGTGLGLTISQRIAEAMEGKVEVLKSVPHQGTTFLVELKVRKSDVRVSEFKQKNELSLQDAETVMSIFEGKKILAVDDSEDNLNLIELYLSAYKVNLDFAENGSFAIDKASQNQPDLILMDIQMPLVDGLEATLEIRRRGFTTPIIALTAHALKSDRMKCLTVGCNDVLVKPIHQAELVRKMAKYLRSPSQ